MIRTSSETSYIKSWENAKALSESKRAEVLKRLASVGDGGLTKIGKDALPPIIMRLRYEGITRQVLKTHELQQGEYPLFPVDTEAEAYVLNAIGGELFVEIRDLETVWVTPMRIGAYPLVKKTDLQMARYDILRRKLDLTEGEIQRQEDRRTLALLNAVCDNYANNPQWNITFTGTLDPAQVHQAIKYIQGRQVPVAQMLMNKGAFGDIMNWGADKIGWKARDTLTSTGVLANYGPLTFVQSVEVPYDTYFVLAPPEYVGLFVIQFALDAQLANKPERGLVGWIYDEFVGFAVLNDRGIVRIRKA